MESPVCPCWNEVLLGEHLDGVSKGMKQSDQPEAHDAGAVRPDSVLNDRRLLALDPGMQPRKVQDPKEHDGDQDELDGESHHYSRGPLSPLGSFRLRGPCAPRPFTSVSLRQRSPLRSDRLVAEAREWSLGLSQPQEDLLGIVPRQRVIQLPRYFQEKPPVFP